MKGSLLQLVSYGAENVNINGDPQITFFTKVFKRYVPFSILNIEEPLNSNANFNNIITIDINKKGDYLSKMYLQVNLPYSSDSNSFWTNRVGFNLIKKAELYIGDNLIEKIYGQWMYIYNNLVNSSEHISILDKLVGYSNMRSNTEQKLIIPLNFCFCKYYETAIPLFSLYNQTVKIKIYFNSLKECHQTGIPPTNKLTNLSLLIDYIFISEFEKKRLLHKKYTMLYENVEFIQRNIFSNSIKNLSLPFNLSSKGLFIVIKSKNQLGDKFTNFTSENNINLLKKLQLKINNNNIFSDGFKNGKYFNNIQSYRYCNTCPDIGINTLSFSLHPFLLQPSGILNFKDIKKLNLLIESLENGIVYIYSLGSDLLTFESGFVYTKNIF
jgi:hypothetical protein